MHLEIVWDERNLEHATATEITQAILDAPHYRKARTEASDRAVLEGTTEGGRRLVGWCRYETR